MAACQMDPKDEIYLALCFLNQRGISYRALAERLCISTKTIVKVASGQGVLQRHREGIFCQLMAEMDKIYLRTHDPKVIEVMAEMGRLHVKLLPNPAIFAHFGI